MGMHTYKRIIFGIIILALHGCNFQNSNLNIFEEQAIFVNGEEGYACYRIPAIVVSKDGTILAFAEGRLKDCDDYGNVDILLKTSNDQGKTWTKSKKIIDQDHLQSGNPAPVFDHTDPAYPQGRLFLFYNRGNASEYEVRTGKGNRTVWYTTSSNLGKQWDTPKEISDQVHFPKSHKTQPKDWRTHANTPGHAIQFSKGEYKGRIYVPANHSTGEPKEDYSDYNTYGFFSDDHGQTWKISDDVPFPSSNEAIGVVLDNGTLMLNIRDQSGKRKKRLIALSENGGENWSQVFFDKALPSPTCQSSLLLDHNEEDPLLLYTGPNSEEKRHKLSVFVSKDQGKTWPIIREIYEGTSAYSDIAKLRDHSYGLLYERDEKGIYYAHFNKEWLLGNPLEFSEPLPSERQLAWQELEYYAFVHFNMNTFTNQEWGYGDASPQLFNPSSLDTDQWAQTALAAGMKGIIITAKHHDGFCLWPSAYTEYSVKNSPWKNGEGDLIKELAESCKKYGLKMGVYLSPWDRNHPDYGKPEYLDYFRNQLTELLTNYGDIFEVWFDGANGGDGYYGGANDTRKVDKKNYYNWEKTIALVRKLQPNAVIFSDAGPDVRWVGNEQGQAHTTSWSPIFKDSVYGGMPDFNRFASGQENGTHWIPTETDVSIRPGWYYHKDQDSLVKSPQQLRDIYYNSIGKNSSLLLNLPVDARGRIHENDSTALIEFSKLIKKDFETDLALSAQLNSKDPYTQEVLFSKPTQFNSIVLQEDIQFGQKVQSFEIMANTSKGWRVVSEGTTIGNKRIIRFATQKAAHLKVRILKAKKTPNLKKIKIYHSPE